MATPASAGPPVLELTGIARDFVEHSKAGGHPDFEVQPGAGFGLYAGLVHHGLGPDGKPVLSGEGYRVMEQPMDPDGNPLAWHLYNSYWVCHSGQPDQNCITLRDSDDVLAYTICYVNAVFNANGTSTWTYSVQHIGGQNLSHWNLKLDPSQQVVSASPNSGAYKVSVGVDGSTGFFGIKWDVPNNFSSGLFTVTLSQQYFGGVNTAGVLAKGGNKSDKADFFGPTEVLSTNGTPYNPTFSLTFNPDMGDEAGEIGSHDSGAIESEASFNQWFRDVPGVNMSKPITLRFVKQADGSYVFDDSLDPQFASLGGFFPLENQLFGQSGGSPDRNFHFTYELHGSFTFDAASNSFIEVEGDDDIWVFINGKLLIDLGGVRGTMKQHADLSRICLSDGDKCTIAIFVAERHRPNSRLRISTDIVLEGKPVPTVTAMYD